MRRESSVELLSLSGLDEDETGALIEAYQGSAPAPGLAHRLHELTGGNPFFLEESLRADDLDAVPAGVREVVLRRVGRLGPQATEVLGLAAVMGVSFPWPRSPRPAGSFARRWPTCSTAPSPPGSSAGWTGAGGPPSPTR